jgi:ribosomal-protein-alanine N-acetyltransferase
MPLVDPGPIESERLTVRLLRESDLPALLEVNGDEVATALLPYPTWTSLDDARAWHSRMAGLQATGLALQFVVVSKASGRAIGTCLLFRYEEGSARVELGYVLGRAHWGCGLMREALTALLDHAFTSMSVRRVEAEVDPRNVASSGLLRRLGFSREGLLRERWVTKGEAKDVEVFGLLKRDRPAARPDAAARGGIGSVP